MHILNPFPSSKLLKNSILPDMKDVTDLLDLEVVSATQNLNIQLFR